MDKLAIQGGTPVREAMLPYGRQWVDEADIVAVVDALKSDFITQGPRIQEFEQAVATYVGAKYAVAFTNGTAALHGACFAAGIETGDEVITTPITFLASSNCVLYRGGNPVFADINKDTYNIDPVCVREKITARTKAIIPVDFTGQPVEIDRIADVAKAHDLVIIQDAAHALGAEWKGRKVGALADMTMFSFHPVKHVTSAEGGMIVTDDPEYYALLQLFRNHGMTRDPARLQRDEGAWYYEMQELGFNYRMTDLQAALGTSQMSKLDGFVSRRREIAGRYNAAFQRLEGVSIPYQHPRADSSWHLYMLRLDLNKFRAGRREIFEALRAENIGVNVHYIPVYLQPYYRRLGYEAGLCPEAERFYEEAITVPLFPAMTDDDAEDVIRAVRKVCAYFSL